MNFKKIDVQNITLGKTKDNGATKGFITPLLYNGQTLMVTSPKIAVSYDCEAKQLKPKSDKVSNLCFIACLLPCADILLSLPMLQDKPMPPLASLSVTLDKSTPDIEAFETFLVDLHTKVKILMKDNSMRNFNEEEEFKKLPALIKSNGADYPPTLTMKMEFEPDTSTATGFKITTPVYSKTREELVAEDVLKRQAQVTVVIEIPYVHSAHTSLASRIKVNCDRVLLLEGTGKKRVFEFDLDESITKEYGEMKKEQNENINTEEEPVAKKAKMADFDEHDDV